jgi:hypothetical protein
MDAEQPNNNRAGGWRNDLAVPPPPDHNKPRAVLAEILVVETADLQAHVDKLVEDAGRVPLIITDLDTAEKATLLAGMMLDHAAAIEAARVVLRDPHMEQLRVINNHFGQLRAPLVGTDSKVMGGEVKRVKAIVDDYYAAEERKAAAERKRLEEEARRKQEAAAQAERDRLAAEAAARTAALQGDVTTALAQTGIRVEAETRVEQLAGDARRLSQQAADTRAMPINTGYGVAAHRQTTHQARITNLTLALRHARKLNEAAIREVVQSIYDRQVRAGVRVLPGADVVPVPRLAIRKR